MYLNLSWINSLYRANKDLLIFHYPTKQHWNQLDMLSRFPLVMKAESAEETIQYQYSRMYIVMEELFKNKSPVIL